jgi:hypothetical protein
MKEIQNLRVLDIELTEKSLLAVLKIGSIEAICVPGMVIKLWFEGIYFQIPQGPMVSVHNSDQLLDAGISAVAITIAKNITILIKLKPS